MNQPEVYDLSKDSGVDVPYQAPVETTQQPPVEPVTQPTNQQVTVPMPAGNPKYVESQPLLVQPQQPTVVVNHMETKDSALCPLVCFLLGCCFPLIWIINWFITRKSNNNTVSCLGLTGCLLFSLMFLPAIIVLIITLIFIFAI